MEQVADCLSTEFGKDKVLYDNYFEEEFSRIGLDVYLPSLYRKESELVVVFLCAEYLEKRWCGLEMRYIREMIATEDEDRIMLIRFDDKTTYEALGIVSGDGFLPIEKKTPNQIAASIVKRSQIRYDSTEQQPESDEVFVEFSNQHNFYGVERSKIHEDLKTRWLSNHFASIAAIQGIPGTGKSQLARQLVSESGMRSLYLPVDNLSDDSALDILFEMLSLVGKTNQSDAIQTSVPTDSSFFLKSIHALLKENRLILVLDDFQNGFENDSDTIPEIWGNLFERVCNEPNFHGKLLIISNRSLPAARWTENAIVKTLTGLENEQAEAFLLSLLSDKSIEVESLDGRANEIVQRLGGNPRALKTLVSGLDYNSIDELLSFAPNISELRDVELDLKLLERFEREVLSRTLPDLSTELSAFLRTLSVHRKPWTNDAMSFLERRFPNYAKLRISLIDRFFLEYSHGMESIHPLVREICVSRLRVNDLEWKRAHDAAANYHLYGFKLRKQADLRKISRSYLELRYHLFEANRISELRNTTKKLSSFILKVIQKQRLAHTPKDRSEIEEHIALIECLPSTERTHGLEFHLALCLRERNLPGDYDRALEHAQRGATKGAYYAAWLLLLEIEYEINGSDSIIPVASRALKALQGKGNSFSIYLRSSELLDKSGHTNKAIAFLREGIADESLECRSVLVTTCTHWLEKSGRRNEAIELILSNLNSFKATDQGPLLVRCARLLMAAGRADEAFDKLKTGMGVEGISKRHAFYLQLSDFYLAENETEEAIRILRAGIADREVIDPKKLYFNCARILAHSGRAAEAIELLKDSIRRKKCRDMAPVIHSIAEILEKAGEYEEAVAIVENALVDRALAKEVSIYLACAKLHFHARRLGPALEVLKRGIVKDGIKDKEQLYHMAGDLASRHETNDEGIRILLEGIRAVPSSNRYGLYMLASKLLTKDNRIDEAIELLRSAIEEPALKNKAPIIQACAKLLVRKGKPLQALDLMENAILMPGLTGIVVVYQYYGEILEQQGERRKAIQVLVDAIKGPKIGNVGSLYRLAGEMLVRDGDFEAAIELLERGLGAIPKDGGIKLALKRIKGNESGGQKGTNSAF